MEIVGYTFILFKHRSNARKVIKQPQKNIGNRMTACQLVSIGPILSLVVGQGAMSVLTTQSMSEYMQRKIFVSNVEAGLKRWETGEIASQIAQPYFG